MWPKMAFDWAQNLDACGLSKVRIVVIFISVIFILVIFIAVIFIAVIFTPVIFIAVIFIARNFLFSKLDQNNFFKARNKIIVIPHYFTLPNFKMTIAFRFRFRFILISLNNKSIFNESNVEAYYMNIQ